MSEIVDTIGDVAGAPGVDRLIKCVVWDLDHTLWRGVLLEDAAVDVNSEAAALIAALDARGILHSIASRNDHDAAIGKLRELGLDHYFVYPQIGWTAKGLSVQRIATELNIGLDALAFVDDDPFERHQVAASAPDVLCVDPSALGAFASSPAVNPPIVTADGASRRLLYSIDSARRAAETAFDGALESFLSTLALKLTIAEPDESDLRRAEELTVRTHQLNTTGYTFSYDELIALRASPDHLLLMASLEDRFGAYGRIALAVIARAPGLWTIRLLLASCRVASRGVGAVMIHYILERARSAGVRLQAEFVPNGRNRPMDLTYRLAGFTELESRDGRIVFEHSLRDLGAYPPYMTVVDGRTDSAA